MRVPDEILKCVVFLGVPQKQLDGTSQIKLRGTAFFVSVPFQSTDERMFVYLVTARHVAQRLAGREFYVRFNKRGGGVGYIDGQATKWWYHPTDANADVAIFPWAPAGDSVDYKVIPRTRFLNSDTIREKNIGIGDEVFIAGLFAHHHGNDSNVPIVRTGSIAMLPADTVETALGPMRAHLIEARSLGGISGSPVFVRETQVINVGGGLSGPSQLLGVGNYYLLGLMHGHWDLPVMSTRSETTEDVQQRVNLGIAIVVPSSTILEVIEHPELIALRRFAEQF